MYNYKKDFKKWNKLQRKTIEGLFQYKNDEIYIQFTDGSTIPIINNGIVNNDVHIKLKEL